VSTRFVPVYRRRPSALHQARPAAGLAFCAAFGLVALLFVHPLVLVGALAGVVAAAAGAGVGGELARVARLAVPLAALTVLINPLVAAQGTTLLVRGWAVLGLRLDVTLEEVAYGGLAGLRVLVLVLAFGLFSAAVDPDEVLRLFRRLSYRSALTASLGTRLVPVLARDAARMGDAARCRPVAPGRAAVARSALAGALERAVEVAAALEVRGYGSAGRPARVHRPWSRHDARVAAAALLVMSTALTARLAGVAGFTAYPTVSAPLGAPELVLCAVVLLGAVAPFAGSAARLGVSARA